MHGRAASGQRAGERDLRVSRTDDVAPFVKARLCSVCDEYSLHQR